MTLFFAVIPVFLIKGASMTATENCEDELVATIIAVFALFFCCSVSRESTLSLAFCFLESDVVMVYFEAHLSSWIVLSFILRTIVTLKTKVFILIRS